MYFVSIMKISGFWKTDFERERVSHTQDTVEVLLRPVSGWEPGLLTLRTSSSAAALQTTPDPPPSVLAFLILFFLPKKKKTTLGWSQVSLGRPGLNYILSTKTLSRNGHQVCPSSSFSFNLLSALPWPLTPPFSQERQQQQNPQLPDKHEMNSELPDLGTVQSAGSGPPIQLSAHFAIFTISGFIWHQFHHATNHTVTRLGGPQI